MVEVVACSMATSSGCEGEDVYPVWEEEIASG